MGVWLLEVFAGHLPPSATPLDSRLRRPLNYSELAIRERFLDLKCGMWGLNQACRVLPEFLPK